MIDQHRKAMIFAPFWGQPGHVGNHRVDRFVRWLAEDGYAVVIVRAGDADGEHVQKTRFFCFGRQRQSLSCILVMMIICPKII
jgi:hypothetical protein